MPRTVLSPRGAIIGVAMILAASASPADTSAMSIDVLKRTYLDCERRATSRRIGTEDVMACSVVYEKLKERAFGGDWKRLRDWTRRNLAPGLNA